MNQSIGLLFDVGKQNQQSFLCPLLFVVAAAWQIQSVTPNLISMTALSDVQQWDY